MDPQSFWTGLTGAALIAAFGWLTLQLWRNSRDVGRVLSIHSRARLSRRLQVLVLASAGVVALAAGMQGFVVTRSLDARAAPTAGFKSLSLRLDPTLQMTPAPLRAPLDDAEIALADSAR